MSLFFSRSHRAPRIVVLLLVHLRPFLLALTRSLPSLSLPLLLPVRSPISFTLAQRPFFHPLAPGVPLLSSAMSFTCRTDLSMYYRRPILSTTFKKSRSLLTEEEIVCGFGDIWRSNRPRWWIVRLPPCRARHFCTHRPGVARTRRENIFDLMSLRVSMRPHANLDVAARHFERAFLLKGVSSRVSYANSPYNFPRFGNVDGGRRSFDPRARFRTMSYIIHGLS